MNAEVKPFRILSLDGGGIRGAFIAAFLAGIEKRIGTRIGEHFDLVVGTSTGGIIAAAVAAGEPCESVAKLYAEDGRKIFTRRPPAPLTWMDRGKATYAAPILNKMEIDWDWVVQSKYESQHLHAATEAFFGSKLIGSLNARLLLTAFDLTNGKPVVYKTPHIPKMTRDRHIRIVDALAATTAAPLYFPHADVNGDACVDGGLWANNPSVVGVAESIKISEVGLREDAPRFNLASTYMLSVGTGEGICYQNPPAGGAGAGWWGPRLVDVMFAAQSYGTNTQAKYLLGNRLARVDFKLPDAGWKLDNADHLEALLRKGEHAAVERCADLEDTFFSTPACHTYTPFPER